MEHSDMPDMIPGGAATQPLTLLQILSNPLILYQTVPYLPVSSLLALGATSKSFRGLVHLTPNIFRYLDLSNVKSVQFKISKIDNGGEVWRNVQLDENVTEDDFYAGPLRGVFGGLKRRHILQDVQTLILDGLSVTSELISEIILDDSFNVRILSIREAQNLNERKLMQALEYSVRPTRRANTPKLQGLYIFGNRDATILSTSVSQDSKYTIPVPRQSSQPVLGVTLVQGAQIGAQLNQRSREALSLSLGGESSGVYGSLGSFISKPPMRGWAETMLACKGLINFDAVLCTGPRHTLPFSGHWIDPDHKRWYAEHEAHLPTAVGTIALPACTSCHSAPELKSTYGQVTADYLPLLAPPPLHSSSIKSARRQSPTSNNVDEHPLVRCKDCLRGRYCEGCHKWWCEDCYRILIGNESRRPPQAVVTALEAAGKSDGDATANLKGAWRDCYECGFNCAECVRRTQNRCNLCGGGYCMIHNEGSTLTIAGRHAIDGCRVPEVRPSI